jgi:hypothetical protein
VLSSACLQIPMEKHNGCQLVRYTVTPIPLCH